MPFSKLKDTTAALTSLQKSISQNNSGLSLSFTLSGTRVSAQHAPACNPADVVARARAQAQQTASAAGLNAGAIVGLTSATSMAVPLVCPLTVRLAVGAMFAQPGPNSITITATRANNIQPDQVLVGLNVTPGTTAGLDDISGALTDAGISGTSFTGVYTTNIYSPTKNPQPALVWSFTLTAPLVKLSSTLSQILSAQKSISGNNSGLTLTVYVERMQVSQQLQESQPCSQAALPSDAQSWAKQVAAAAGVSVGSILSMAGGGGAVLASLQVAPAFAANVTLFNPVAVPANFPFFTPTVLNTPHLACSLTVQFQLMLPSILDALSRNVRLCWRKRA